jgi:hypothetical protein
MHGNDPSYWGLIAQSLTLSPSERGRSSVRRFREIRTASGAGYTDGTVRRRRTFLSGAYSHRI